MAKKRKKRKKSAGTPKRKSTVEAVSKPKRPIRGWPWLLGGLVALAGVFLYLNRGDSPEGVREDSPEDSLEGFVRVKGQSFVLDGNPYRFVGMNYWQGAYLGADIIAGGQQRMARELDFMKRSGISNLRITAATELSAIEKSLRPAFQEGPGEYNEQLLEGLDRLLDEMAKRDMKAVMVMGNYWRWSGGMAQYHAWGTGAEVNDREIAGMKDFLAYAAGFYSNKKALSLYDRYLEHVIRRVNTINRRRYAEDPTIMAWQLANEPRPHPDARKNDAAAEDYYRWIAASSKKIRALAPKQLISLGNEGLVGSVGREAIYKKAHDLPSIDYLTFHIWPKNWRWYRPGHTTQTLKSSIVKSIRYFQRHIGYARSLNKPTVLEEFGLGRHEEQRSPDAPVAERDAFLGALFGEVERSVEAGGPMMGANVWSWAGEGRPTEAQLWTTGSDFTGDPPHEPQGLNSVYDTDKSTLALMKRHAKRLEQLSRRRPQ